MPKYTKTIAAMILAGALAAPAAAAPLSFDCDVPEGRSSSVTSVTGATLRLMTVVNAVAPRPGKTPPSAGIAATASEGRTMIALQLSLPAPDAKAFALTLVGRAGGKPFQRPLGTLAFGGKISLGVLLDANGKGQIAVGPTVAPVDLADSGPWRAQAFCGSGQFRFDDLTMAAN